MIETILKARDVAFRWPGRRGFSLTLPAFEMVRGETVLLVGDSGSGKSTLLSLICGTVLPDTGRIEIAGTDLTRLSSGARDSHRAEQIGIVFQQFNLLPFGTVMDNILLPLYFAPARSAAVADAKATARNLCNRLGLPKGIEKTPARALSMGQQQRVAAARAMIGAPPLIVADEPTSALDTRTQTSFLDVLFRQTATQNTALLMVSHDPRLGGQFDRVIHIEDIAQTGQVAV